MGLRKYICDWVWIHSAKSARPPDSIGGRATCADVDRAAETVLGVVTMVAPSPIAQSTVAQPNEALVAAMAAFAPARLKMLTSPTRLTSIAASVRVSTLRRVIGAEYHAMADFTLNADVQLQRARRLVIGVE